MMQVETPRQFAAFPDGGETQQIGFLAIIPNGGVSRSV
jgi:hypothetical protein